MIVVAHDTDIYVNRPSTLTLEVLLPVLDLDKCHIRDSLQPSNIQHIRMASLHSSSNSMAMEDMPLREQLELQLELQLVPTVL